MFSSDMLHIALHLYCETSFGGAERRLLRAYSDVAKQAKVDLVVRERVPGIFSRSCDSAGVALEGFNEIRLVSSRIKQIGDIKALLCCTDKRYSSHVFFDYSRYNAVAADIALRFSDAGIVFTSADCSYGHSGSIFDSDDSERFSHLIERASWIDTLYPDQKAMFEAITRKKNVSVTPGTFTDLEQYRPSPKNKKIVFLSARLDGIKNPQLFLDAIEEISNELRSFGYTAFMCGKGPDYEKYLNEVEQKGLSDIIHMPGYVRSYDMLPDAEMVCVLSAQENYPSQVLAEGCASGCYIIATDVGNTHALVKDGFGSLVSCDAKSVGRAICDYINLAREQKEAIVDASRRFAEDNNQKQNTVEYFLDINRLAYAMRRQKEKRNG